MAICLNNYMFEKRKLKNALAYYVHHQEVLRKIFYALDKSGIDWAIVGGFVRYILENGNRSLDNGPRDFDIVIDCSLEYFSNLIDSLGVSYTQNDFGGIKIKGVPGDTFAGKEIDIWMLENHEPFKIFESEYAPFPSYSFRTPFVNFKNIPDSAWISIDGATWVVNKNKLYAKNAKKSIKSNSIFITNYDLFKKYKNKNSFILAAKLIKYYYLGYTLDKDCWDIIKTEMTKNPDKVEDFLNSHYKYYMSWRNFIDEKIIRKIS